MFRNHLKKLAVILLLGAGNGVTTPMGYGAARPDAKDAKPYTQTHFGRHSHSSPPKGTKPKPKPRPEFKRKPEHEGPNIHWNSKALARVGLRKVRHKEERLKLVRIQVGPVFSDRENHFVREVLRDIRPGRRTELEPIEPPVALAA
jgi:hypothetical protein